MRDCNDILEAYKAVTYLSLDDVLDSFNVSHLDYRKWCYYTKRELPAITKGLVQEVLLACEDYSRDAIAKKWFMTLNEVNNCLYKRPSTKPFGDKTKRVIDLLKRGKLSQESIAHLCGLSQARVSQIKKQWVTNDK